MRAVAIVAFLILAAAPAFSAPENRVEVVAVQGIIDAPTERAIKGAIRDAEESRPRAVVLQIDSAGSIIGPRMGALLDTVGNSSATVVTWIGPPGARAAGGAALLAAVGDVVAMSPGSAYGPSAPEDLRGAQDLPGSRAGGIDRAYSAQEAEERGLAHELALQLPDLLRKLDERGMRTDPEEVSIRFRKLDLLGRVQHAVTQPSMAYLLLLLGLVGVVFELFHPSRGPAGLGGLLSLALSLYGISMLGGSWLGVALVAAGVAGFCVDLRVEGLGLFTLLGLAGLIAGSLLLFPAPTLRASPWLIAVGIMGMVAFLLGAMTRVLRDLRAFARGGFGGEGAAPPTQARS